MSNSFSIRPMRASDNPAFLKVIQACVLEFGYTHSPYVTHADEEGDIFGCFDAPRCAAYVIVDDADVIVGGGGYAPVQSMEHLCEIKKVYFAPRVRGHGFGRKLVERLMEEALVHDYEQFYIESVPEMTTALALYEKLGFMPAARQGAAGHGCCSIFMLRPATERKPA